MKVRRDSASSEKNQSQTDKNKEVSFYENMCDEVDENVLDNENKHFY